MTKILLVEDNEINQDMLNRRLLRRGYEVVLASNGEEGLSMALAEQPDLILMDMSLPVMDGWEATRRLKADKQTSFIPVLALTAHAMVGDLEKTLEAGCDDYDTKPVELPRLLQKMETLLAKSKPVEPVEIEHKATSLPESKPSIPDEAPSSGLTCSGTLLIVDDNDMNRDMLSRRLQRAGYTILLAASGEEGLEIIRQQAVDLVLLDIMMPGISGLDTLRLIREMYSKAQLPTIMVTAKDQSDDIVQAFELGANDYITKPIDFPVALARTQSQLNIIQAARREEVTKPAEESILAAAQIKPVTPLLLRRYAITELFIQDEFRHIYLAQDTQSLTNSTCAIEQLTLTIDTPELLESARYLFKAEIERFNLLNKNDRVPGLLNYFEQDEKFYLVQEVIEGTLVSEEINPGGSSQGLAYVVNLVVQALKILETLHQHHLAHQNLQPNSFIYRKPDRQLVLFNSGIAARLKTTLQQKYSLLPLTKSSTEMYAAPEQGIGQPTFSNDIYSIGAIALQFLTGITPNKIPTNPKIRQLVWGQVALKNQGFAQILQKMLHENPQERYLSARDALNDIYKLSSLTKP